MARGLRDAGFHMIYAGLWQPVEAVVQTALDEDADWLGISLLSGAHMALIPPMMKLLREKGLENVGVLVGGIIPERRYSQAAGIGGASGLRTGDDHSRNRRLPPEGSAAETEPEDLINRFRQKDRHALPAC